MPQLGNVVYHNKLGSQLDRVERVRALAIVVAQKIGADPALADRAALLAKADLVTNMVGEFPELQGIMGRYYALADGEDPKVADAIGKKFPSLITPIPNPYGKLLLFGAGSNGNPFRSLGGASGTGRERKGPFGPCRAALGLIARSSIPGTSSRIADKKLVSLVLSH